MYRVITESNCKPDFKPYLWEITWIELFCGFLQKPLYCDDFIVMMRDSERAEALKQELATYIDQDLKMRLSQEKTMIVQAQDGFDFLGVHTFVTQQRSNPTKTLPYQIPAQRSVKAYRQKVKQLTHCHLDYMPPGERISALNWLIRGWANYHH